MEGLLATGQIIETMAKHCNHYYIRGNRYRSMYDDIFALRGWKRLSRSFMAENAVFIILTALIRNFYQLLVSGHYLKAFGLKATAVSRPLFSASSRFRQMGDVRQHVLNLYSENKAYAGAFQNDFG